MVRAQQYRMFWLRLAKMIEAGLPLLRAINILIAQTDGRKVGRGEDNFDYKLKSFLRNAAGRIMENRSHSGLSEAMKESGMFAADEIRVIREAGSDSEVEIALKRLAGLIPENDSPIPDFKWSTSASEYEYFFNRLGLMISDEVPLLEALDNVSLTSFALLRKALINIREEIRDGNSLAVAMDSSKAFSAMEVRLVDVGEEAGCLDEMLIYLAKLSAPIKINE